MSVGQLAVAEQREDPAFDRDVERGRGLVGEQQVGPTRERERDHHALPHPARELVRHTRAGPRRVFAEVDGVEELVDARRAYRLPGRAPAPSPRPDDRHAGSGRAPRTSSAGSGRSAAHGSPPTPASESPVTSRPSKRNRAADDRCADARQAARSLSGRSCSSPSPSRRRARRTCPPARSARRLAARAGRRSRRRGAPC